MLGKNIEFRLLDTNTLKIVEQKKAYLNLKEYYVEFYKKAKVQDFVDGAAYGEERVLDTKVIFFKENISKIARIYLSRDELISVRIDIVGVTPIEIYFDNEREADNMMQGILDYKLGRQ